MIVKTCISPEGNFGDSAINSYLVEKLTGKKPRLISISKKINEENYLLSGSILASADRNSIIWGSGFLSNRDKIKEKPKKVYAVRGKHSRALLLKFDVDCPAVYGDPALILPRIFKPEIKKKSLLGLVPHYADTELKEKYPEGEVINICGGVEKVITDICSFQVIVSSSLHGLIVADAYNIPAYWYISKAVKGKGFKFYDYLTIRHQVNLDEFYAACPLIK